MFNIKSISIWRHIFFSYLGTETYIQDIKGNNKGAGSPSLPSRYKRKGFEKKTKGEKKGRLRRE